jgi:hypothetical protein
MEDNIDNDSSQANSGRDEKLLQFFWDLASVDAFQRASTTKELILHLKESTDKAGTDLILPATEYTLKRLIRGLNSSREGARQGFATALTQVLIQFQEISIVDVFQQITIENLISKKGQVLNYLKLIGLRLGRNCEIFYLEDYLAFIQLSNQIDYVAPKIKERSNFLLQF